MRGRGARGAAAALLAALLVAVLAGCGGDDELEPRPEPAETAFGFNEAVGVDSAANELFAEIGASFVRVPVSWAAVESRPGMDNWRVPDGIGDELAAIGLRPLWVVTGAPCWAAQAKCTKPRPGLAPAREHVDGFARFAARVAERYPDAIGIEVWNEPNVPKFWRPSPDPALYRELLAKTADAIRASGSELPVVMGGASPTSAEQVAEVPDKIEFGEFIDEVMAPPDAPDVDGIGAHPYSLLQSDERDPVEESIRLVDEFEAAAERVAPDVPIWVTEVGLTTAGRHRVKLTEQADGLAVILEVLRERGVPVVAVHRFFDAADPPFPFEAGFGVVEADRSTRKPSFCAVAEVMGGACEA